MKTASRSNGPLHTKCISLVCLFVIYLMILPATQTMLPPVIQSEYILNWKDYERHQSCLILRYNTDIYLDKWARIV